MSKTNDRKKEGKAKTWLPWIVSGAVVLGLVLGWFIFPGYREFLKEGYQTLSSGNEKQISEWVNGFGFWGPFLIILGMVVQMFAIVINVVLLMLVAILAYGPLWGSVIAISGIAVASTMGYFIGKLLGMGTVGKLVSSKVQQKIEAQVKKYGYWTVVIFRLSPWLSNDAISFVAGVMQMNYWKFIGATILGIIPLTVLIAWLGQDWERLKSGLIWISIATVVLLAAYTVYDKKFRKEK